MFQNLMNIYIYTAQHGAYLGPIETVEAQIIKFGNAINDQC